MKILDSAHKTNQKDQVLCILHKQLNNIGYLQVIAFLEIL